MPIGVVMEIASSIEHYWTEPRTELRAWLQRNAPSLAELYEGALRIAFDGNFPGRTRFIAHAVREISNRLPGVIAGEIGGSTLQYKNRVDTIAKAWQRSGYSLDGIIPTGVGHENPALSPDIQMPPQLFKEIASLLKDHSEVRETKQEAASRLFEAIAPENQILRDTLRPVIMQWLKINEWFMKYAHDNGSQDEDVDKDQFQSQFELFETTLSALTRSYFKTIEGLDEILEDTNS
jgi:hypothetical protein